MGEEKLTFVQAEAWGVKLALQQRFSITREGRMGLAPQSAATGDHVIVFASGDMPFVIRQVDACVEEEAYFLIGGCYLDGKHLMVEPSVHGC